MVEMGWVAGCGCMMGRGVGVCGRALGECRYVWGVVRGWECCVGAVGECGYGGMVGGRRVCAGYGRVWACLGVWWGWVVWEGEGVHVWGRWGILRVPGVACGGSNQG